MTRPPLPRCTAGHAVWCQECGECDTCAIEAPALRARVELLEAEVKALRNVIATPTASVGAAPEVSSQEVIRHGPSHVEHRTTFYEVLTTCSACDGKGRFEDGDDGRGGWPVYVDCVECEGTGKKQRTSDALPPCHGCDTEVKTGYLVDRSAHACLRPRTNEARPDLGDLAKAWLEKWVYTDDSDGPNLLLPLVDLLAGAIGSHRPETPEARPFDEWHDDHGPVLWWAFPVAEPPYAGTPLDDDFPEYATHWTKLPPVPATPKRSDGTR